MTDSDLPDIIPVKCPECGTRTAKPPDEIDDAIRTHNENLHDGQPVAGIPVMGGKKILGPPSQVADGVHELTDALKAHLTG